MQVIKLVGNVNFMRGSKRGWETEKYIVEEFASLLGDTPLAQITTWQIKKAEAGKRLNPVTVNRPSDGRQGYVQESRGVGSCEDQSGNFGQKIRGHERAHEVSNRI